MHEKGCKVNREEGVREKGVRVRSEGGGIIIGYAMRGNVMRCYTYKRTVAKNKNKKEGGEG